MRPSIFLSAWVCAFLLTSCSGPGTPEHTVDPTAVSLASESPVHADFHAYAWLDSDYAGQSLEQRIAPPKGFSRKPADEKSMAHWLRGLPLKEQGSPVLLYNGNLKYNQDAHVAVVALDVGDKDLQQCADAVMRLRAEYLWSRNRDSEIHFNYTSGHIAKWQDWKKGMRPQISGNSVNWKQTAGTDSSRKAFRAYLNNVFNYAGTASLEKELKPVTDLSRIEAGDVFIHGGHPGHAVLVLDVALDESGNKMFLIGQSYMPAQEFQVLKNPMNSSASPWYSTDFEGDLQTPEWTFGKTELRRWQVE